MRPLKKVLINFSLATAFLAMFSLGLSDLAQAQDEFVLEEVTVTAEKREADLQKIPIAIEAVTGDTLVRTGVNELGDLDKLLPDLRIDSGGQFILPTIRNVNTFDFTPLYEMITAVFIDNVFLPTDVGYEGLFFDLERVETLKGPQGTLYGRAATAGSINLISKKPVLGIFGGNAEVEYGNFDRMRAEGGINIPVSENVAMRAAFRSLYHGPYNENGWGTDNNRGLRGSLLWEPSDRQSLLVTIDFVHVDRKEIDDGIYFSTYGSLKGKTVDLPWDSSSYYADADEGHINRTDAWGFMAQYDHDMDFATLSMQYGHRDLQYHRIARGGGTNIVWDPATTSANLVPSFRFQMLDSRTPGNSNQLEARLISNTTAAQGDAWEWVVGGNVISDKRCEVVVSNFVNFDARMRAKTKALFGQATWSLLDRWHLTGGYRYSIDDKRMQSSTVEEYPNKDWPATPVNYRDASWREPSYKVNIGYDISDEVMTYIQYARGQKVGNLETNRVALPSEILDAYEWGLKSRFFEDRLQVNADAYYYHYKNYNQWYNGGWCISDANGDHFCDDVNGDGVSDNDDMDPYYTGSVSPGDSESKGVSVALQWLITAKDRVRANFMWQTSKYKTFNLQAAVLALYPTMDTYLRPGYSDDSGREFGGPPMRGNVSYMHRFDIGDTGTLEVTGDLYYEGQGIDQIQFQGETKEYAMPGRDAYWLGDISARYSSSYGMPSGMLWHVRAWCNNVWDSTDLSARTFSSTHSRFGDVYPDHSGTVSGTYVYPRTMGIAIGANW